MLWGDSFAEPEGKRLRTAEWQVAAVPDVSSFPMMGASFLGHPTAGYPAACATAMQSQLHFPQPPPAGGSDITRMIMAALHGHSASASSSAPPPAPAVPEPQLGNLLLDSLRTLLPTGDIMAVCQGSSDGQALAHLVQQSMAPVAYAAPTAAPAAALVAAYAAAALAGAAELPAPEPRPRHLKSSRSLKAPAPAVLPEEESDSDDGEPHRLPPGFGAIPEDIVEERARQREEQRVLELKATQPCRFTKRCKRRDCPNMHPEGRDIDTAWNPCAFGRRCKRKDCFYDHPEGRVIDDNPERGMCRFGVKCGRQDCLYDHPDGRATVGGALDARICYFCHDPGHIAGDCPRNAESWNFNRDQQGAIVAVARRA